MLGRKISAMAISSSTALRNSNKFLSFSRTHNSIRTLYRFGPFNSVALTSTPNLFISFCSASEHFYLGPPKSGSLKPGLYLVGTPIGNLEDITLRALRVLKAADVILSEDTRHSGKLLQHYNIKTPLLSYHKFNEYKREQTVISRLQEGEIVALISDAGTPGISDPGMELAQICAGKDIPVIPIPGPSALVAALSASGLPINEFTFVGFLPKHAGSRKERLMLSAKEAATQIFFVPPHKLLKFLDETINIFTATRRCVIAREMTKIHEEFWRGTLGDARDVFSNRVPKGEITVLIEGKPYSTPETPSESQLENELRELISKGISLSTAVKQVAEETSTRRTAVYSLALRKFRKKRMVEGRSDDDIANAVGSNETREM